jgi:hypothetical protein
MYDPTRNLSDILEAEMFHTQILSFFFPGALPREPHLQPNK